MRRPGFEPGLCAWQAHVLATGPTPLPIIYEVAVTVLNYRKAHHLWFILNYLFTSYCYES